MRHILIIFSFVIAHAGTTALTAQITSVGVFLEHDITTNHYHCFLSIDEGQSTSKVGQIQFNSQIVIEGTKGEELTILSSYNPLYKQSNQAADWVITSQESLGAKTLFAISPDLSNTASYSDLTTGDKVKLFSVKNESNKSIQIAQNTIENKNINGSDFSNAMCIGGAAQLYREMEVSSDDDIRYVGQEK